jgi:hypothetical protein
MGLTAAFLYGITTLHTQVSSSVLRVQKLLNHKHLLS